MPKNGGTEKSANGSRSANSNSGLITPRSVGTVSPRPVKDEDGLVLILQNLMTTDFRKSSVQRELPDVSWDQIASTLSRMDVPDQFTKTELELIISEWYSERSINFQLIEDECFSRARNTIHSKVMLLEEKYGSKREVLSCSEICALEICHEHQHLTYRAASKFLPKYTKEQFRDLASSHFSYRMRWTSPEVNLIEQCLFKNEKIEEIIQELPFRKPSEVRQKAQAVSRKLNIESKSASNTEYQSKIEKLVNTDLTASGIKKASEGTAFAKVIRDIQEFIENRGGGELLPFTKPENEIIRARLHNKITKAECNAELIFRSKDEIEKRKTQLGSIFVRQKKFTNTMERLLYEAQWYSSMAEDSARGSRKRRTRASTSQEGESDTKKEVKETEEQAQERLRRNELRAQKRLETMKKKQEQRELLRAKRVSQPRTRSRRIRTRSGSKSQVSKLLEEADWFQSVSGDGHTVKEGAKRKRSPALQIVPEFKNRQKLKAAKKQLEETAKRKRGRPRLKSESPTTEDSDQEEELLKKFEKALDSDASLEDEEFSPYDPTSIINDSTVELGSRQLFNEAISTDCLFPYQLPFCADISVMLQPGNKLPINNILAATLIREHIRSYKSLPDSFPPLYVEDPTGRAIPNPRNIIHIRHLLYPQHTEQYILAVPKTLELDPINEIVNLFQIHYGLYFSYSEAIKTIIHEEYCEKLTLSVKNNDFSTFMQIIDRWNALMLELSPYPIEIDPTIDINESLRGYLPRNFSYHQNVKDFKLQTFYMEILAAGEKARNCPKKMEKLSVQRRMSLTLKSPSTLLAQNGQTDFKEHDASNTYFPEVFVSRFRHLRPMAYSVAFIDSLTHMTSLSRYTVHQLIMRAYTRVVSPSSRKLRTYKAFSAEVYGELLPSFVSEVLSKINLEPGDKFYDLGCGVGNTTIQAALEFGTSRSGGCEIMDHASHLASLQEIFMQKQISVFGLEPLNLSFALDQSFVKNEAVRKECIECDVVLVNNYLFDFPLNVEVGRLLYGMRPGSKIISLKNFIPPRYKSSGEKTILDYLKVERFEISDYCSVSWTANKVSYYISTVQQEVLKKYL